MSGRSKGSYLLLNWRLCLQTSGSYRFPAILGHCRLTEGRVTSASLVWPRSQRSGCIPAEPCPLLRPARG